MKKLSTVIIILILEIVFHNMNYVNAQPDPKLDELNKVSDYKNNKGTMGNVRIFIRLHLLKEEELLILDSFYLMI